MNIDDFRCMREGIVLSTLHVKETELVPGFVNYYSPNKNRALLLLHGFSSTPAVFRHFLPILSQYYDAIIAPALPGHGKDLLSFSTIKATDWLDKIEKTCGELTQEFKEIDVLGLSLGGLLACHLAKLFSLRYLYLLAPALDLHLNLSKKLKLAQVLNSLGFNYLRSKAGNLHQSNHYEIAYRKLPISTIIEVLTLIKQFNFTLPSCPTHLFLGCHDRVVDSTRVATRFTDCPHINIHWLANSAHVLPLDGDSQIIIDCIINHI